MAVEIRVGKYEFDTETGKIAPTDEDWASVSTCWVASASLTD